MNPVDHPHGGGEGRSKGNHPQTPWAPYYQSYNTWAWSYSHEARRPYIVFQWSEVTGKIISPTLFADGHALREDFTASIRKNPSYPAEATPEWYFYEAAQGAPNPAAVKRWP